jgi:UDP-glucose 4-epimerase
MITRAKILVTGGTGYIGSHTIIQLINSGYEVVIIDNLCNSKMSSLYRIQELTGKSIKFYKTDLLERERLDKIITDEKPDYVIHFAGLKAVGESVQKPLYYYNNNLSGTLALLELMAKHNIFNIVFSSSATVYGNPHKVPITEDFPLQATNPYGRTKLFIEEMLRDLFISDSRWNIVILRYFNPVGAHPSGLIGEDPNGIPNNLVPFIAKVAHGKFPELKVYGNDYPTIDGTGVRDYIHVEDLAFGHIKALEKLMNSHGCFTYNLGTGIGYSVLEMIKAFESASMKKVNYKIVGRRSGDIASCFADSSLAKKELGWSATRGIEDMCNDVWRWQVKNPNGFE